MQYPQARSIPIIPKLINADLMIPYINSLKDIPIGYSIYDGTIVKYDFASQKITPIIGNSLILENKFIINLIKILNSIPVIKLTIIDFANSLYDFDGEDYYINSEFTQAIENIKTNNNDKITNVYILNGISVIYDKVLDEGINSLFDIFNNLSLYNNSYFILTDNSAPFKKTTMEQWYSNNNIYSIIWAGKGVDNQTIMPLNLSKADLSNNNDTIYIICNGQYKVLKGLGAGDE